MFYLYTKTLMEDVWQALEECESMKALEMERLSWIIWVGPMGF